MNDAVLWPRPIPVGERLPAPTKSWPKGENYVLIYSQQPGNEPFWAIAFYYEHRDGVGHWTDDSRDEESIPNVTHWLPLPPAPEDVLIGTREPVPPMIKRTTFSPQYKANSAGGLCERIGCEAPAAWDIRWGRRIIAHRALVCAEHAEQQRLEFMDDCRNFPDEFHWNIGPNFTPPAASPSDPPRTD